MLFFLFATKLSWFAGPFPELCACRPDARALCPCCPDAFEPCLFELLAAFDLAPLDEVPWTPEPAMPVIEPFAAPLRLPASDPAPPTPPTAELRAPFATPLA